MNKERYNQIIDEAWKKYLDETRFTSNPEWLEPVPVMDVKTGEKNWGARQYHRNDFIKKCKTDTKFSERWGLKIEERELSLDERLCLVNYDKNRFNSIDEWINWYNNEPNEFYYMGINYTKETALTDLGVPIKLLTIIYKDTKTEVYE